MTDTQTIMKAIGYDLSEKLNKSDLNRFDIWGKLNICSHPKLKQILDGECANVLPMDKIVRIYRAIGETEINIKTDDFKFFVKIGALTLTI